MYTLDFIVDGDTISLDSECDVNNLVPGPDGYLRAKFRFSSVWDGRVKVAAFFSNLGREYEPQIIDENNTCVIPAEALNKSIFKVQIIGQNSKYKLRTNKVKVYRKGGKV